MTAPYTLSRRLRATQASALAMAAQRGLPVGDRRRRCDWDAPVTMSRFWGAAVPAPKTCQWIEGAPSRNDDCKCGAPAAPGRPYCADHSALASRPEREWEAELRREGGRPAPRAGGAAADPLPGPSFDRLRMRPLAASSGGDL